MIRSKSILAIFICLLLGVSNSSPDSPGSNSSPSGTGNEDYTKDFDWNTVNSSWDQAGSTITAASDSGNGGNMALSASGRKLGKGGSGVGNGGQGGSGVGNGGQGGSEDGNGASNENPGGGNDAGTVNDVSDSSEDGTYGNIADQISEPSVNATNASEYVATYEILTNGTYKFDISYGDYCNTSIANKPITLKDDVYNFTQTSGGFLNVTMLLNLTTLAKDEEVYYLTDNNETATIIFCMTVELHKDPSTVNLFYHNTTNTTSGYVAYRSTIINATLDLLQEFEGSFMVKDITTADLQDQLTPDLEVNSYMCMENGTEIQQGGTNAPLYTNEDFHFCVDVTSLDYAKIDSIQELMFKSENQWIYLPISQGESKSELIDDPDLNTVSQKGIIHLKYLPVVLYSSVEDDRVPVVISGTVILTFGSRMLEVSFESVPRRDRELQPSSDQASFESVVEFTKNDTNDDDEKQPGMFAGIAVGSALVVGVVLMISFKRRKSKNAIVNVEACDLVEIGVNSGTNKGGVSS